MIGETGLSLSNPLYLLWGDIIETPIRFVYSNLKRSFMFMEEVSSKFCNGHDFFAFLNALSQPVIVSDVI